MASKLFAPRHVYVWCHKCGTKHKEDDVSFINLFYNDSDESVLTFKCPGCKEVTNSVRKEEENGIIRRGSRQRA